MYNDSEEYGAKWLVLYVLLWLLLFSIKIVLPVFIVSSVLYLTGVPFVRIFLTGIALGFVWMILDGLSKP